jgi:hypothetical protein
MKVANLRDKESSVTTIQRYIPDKKATRVRGGWQLVKAQPSGVGDLFYFECKQAVILNESFQFITYHYLSYARRRSCKNDISNIY